MHWLETLGTITAVTYLCLIAHRHRIAWFFYILSSLAFIPVFFSAQLYADTVLQLFFVVMGSIAWRSWTVASGDSVEVYSWDKGRLLALTLAIGITSAIVGLTLFLWTTAGTFAFPDAFILVASIAATFLTVWRIVENWWLWLAVNITTVVVYTLKAMWITSSLACLYTILTVYGLYKWRLAQSRRAPRSTPASIGGPE